MPFVVERATINDVADIAKIFLSDSTSDFLRLQLGTVDPATLNEGFTERLTESLQQDGQVYIVARDRDTGEIVSYAQWKLPRDQMDAVISPTPEVRFDCRAKGCSVLMPKTS